MTGVWALAALWFGLALIASLVSSWFRGSTALTEIIIGIVAQLIIGAIIGTGVLGKNDKSFALGRACSAPMTSG